MDHIRHITGATFRDDFHTGPVVVTYHAHNILTPWLRRYVWTLDSWGGIDAAATTLRGESPCPGVYLLARHDCPEIARMVTIDRN